MRLVNIYLCNDMLRSVLRRTTFQLDIVLTCDAPVCIFGSIISTHEDCCEQLVENDLSFRACIKVLKKYPGANNIVVRMGYALGNLMARSEPARVKVSRDPSLTESR